MAQSNVFRQLPKIQYYVDDYTYFITPDITINAKIKSELSAYKGLQYYKYVIEDGQRPDQVSYKLYGRANLDWLILMINDIIDPFNQWPQSDYEIKEKLKRDYGSLNVANETIVEYRNSTGLVIDRQTYQTLPISEKSRLTASEKAFEENRKKSHIKVLNAALAKRVESDILDLIKTIK